MRPMPERITTACLPSRVVDHRAWRRCVHRGCRRRADFGIATCFVASSTREASSKRCSFECRRSTQQAAELERESTRQRLVSWFREGVAFTRSYSGVCAVDGYAHATRTPASRLSTACGQRGARLLLRAHAEGTARADINGVDLFALMSGLPGSPADPRSRHGRIILRLLRAPS